MEIRNPEGIKFLKQITYKTFINMADFKIYGFIIIKIEYKMSILDKSQENNS